MWGPELLLLRYKYKDTSTKYYEDSCFYKIACCQYKYKYRPIWRYKSWQIDYLLSDNCRYETNTNCDKDTNTNCDKDTNTNCDKDRNTNCDKETNTNQDNDRNTNCDKDTNTKNAANIFVEGRGVVVS